MANDIIAKCIVGNVIDNGGIVIAAPRGAVPTGTNYQINTYSVELPTTGTVYSKYDARFTGLAPCQGCGTTACAVATSGVLGVMFV